MTDRQSKNPTPNGVKVIVKRINLLILLSFISLSVGLSSETIPSSSRKILPIAVGDTLPDLILTNTDHQSVHISNYLSEQPLILIYYRGGW